MREICERKSYEDHLDKVRKEVEKENMRPIRLVPLAGTIGGGLVHHHTCCMSALVRPLGHVALLPGAILNYGIHK